MLAYEQNAESEFDFTTGLQKEAQRTKQNGLTRESRGLTSISFHIPLCSDLLCPLFLNEISCGLCSWYTLKHYNGH